MSCKICCDCGMDFFPDDDKEQCGKCEELDKFKNALLKIEEIIFQNELVHPIIRDQIQKIVICDCGLTPKPKSR